MNILGLLLAIFLSIAGVMYVAVSSSVVGKANEQIDDLGLDKNDTSYDFGIANVFLAVLQVILASVMGYTAFKS